MSSANEKLIEELIEKLHERFILGDLSILTVKELMLILAEKKDEEFLENLNVFKVYINSLDFTADTEKEREFLRTQISNAIYKIILKEAGK